MVVHRWIPDLLEPLPYPWPLQSEKSMPLHCVKKKLLCQYATFHWEKYKGFNKPETISVFEFEMSIFMSFKLWMGGGEGGYYVFQFTILAPHFPIAFSPFYNNQLTGPDTI